MYTLATDAEVRARLSWVWVFVLFNMVFADIFSFMSAGFLRQVIEARAGEVEVTPGFLLAAAIVTAIPVSMVVLCQSLPARANRWANVAVAIGKIAYVWVGGVLTLPHYVFFASLETVGCLYIAWFAWRVVLVGAAPVGAAPVGAASGR